MSRRSSRCFVLDTMKLGVNAIASKQLAVRTFFRDDAVLENDDLVGLAYGAQAMCDHDDRAAFHQLSQTFDNETL